MSQRSLWLITLPLAFLAWLGVALFTAVAPPSPAAFALLLPLAGLAVTMTAAVPILLLARAAGLHPTGDRPALALRAAAWLGLWVAAFLGLRFARVPGWAVPLGLAVVLGLFETFLLQSEGGGLGRSRVKEHRVRVEAARGGARAKSSSAKAPAAKKRSQSGK